MGRERRASRSPSVAAGVPRGQDQQRGAGEELRKYLFSVGLQDRQRYTEPAMSLPLTAEPPPLTPGDDGVVRVGGTRVTLDTIVEAFREGLTPEEVQQQYPALDLPNVYAAVSYYLHHRREVEEYLEERARHREEIRQEVETRFDPNGIRERLLARARA